MIISLHSRGVITQVHPLTGSHRKTLPAGTIIENVTRIRFSGNAVIFEMPAFPGWTFTLQQSCCIV
jgi:hypothetical protein